MVLLLVLVAALAPVAVALWYIFKQDSAKPEPKKWLIKAFFYGVLSALLALVLCFPCEFFIGGGFEQEYSSIVDAFIGAFASAAIPEEAAKLIMLWLLVKNNLYFDEKFDGIVYAVFISMGFAGFENILYLINGLGDGSWVGTGIVRALFSIPGHFFFAVLMGYYYSLYHFGIDRSNKAKAMIIVAPVLAHGIFDGILFSQQVDEGIAGLAMLVFLYAFNKLRKKASERIQELKNT